MFWGVIYTAFIGILLVFGIYNFCSAMDERAVAYRRPPYSGGRKTLIATVLILWWFLCLGQFTIGGILSVVAIVASIALIVAIYVATRGADEISASALTYLALPLGGWVCCSVASLIKDFPLGILIGLAFGILVVALVPVIYRASSRHYIYDYDYDEEEDVPDPINTKQPSEPVAKPEPAPAPEPKPEPKPAPAPEPKPEPKPAPVADDSSKPAIGESDDKYAVWLIEQLSATEEGRKELARVLKEGSGRRRRSDRYA